MIGLVPWSLRLAAVDLDRGKAAAVTHALNRNTLANIQTPSGGRHLFFPVAEPYPNRQWQVGGSGGDIRGGNGYVCLWAPGELADALAADPGEPVDLAALWAEQGGGNGADALAEQWLREHLGAIASAPDGSRNNTLFASAARIFALHAGGRIADPTDAIRAAALRAAPEESTEIEASIESARKAGESNPDYPPGSPGAKQTSEPESDAPAVDYKIFNHDRQTWKYGPRYWLRGLLSPGLCVLAGAPGSGKSTLVTSLVAAIAGGKPDFCGIPISTAKRRVLFVSNEERPDQTGSRLEAAKNLYEIDYAIADQNLFAVATESTTTLRDLGQHLQACGDPKSFQLIAIDSYSTMGIDTNSETEVENLASQLKALGQHAGLTVLLVAHPAKQDRQIQAMEIRGNDRLRGESDTFLFLDGESVLHNPKSRDSLQHPPRKIEIDSIELGADVHGDLKTGPAVRELIEIAPNVGESLQEKMIDRMRHLLAERGELRNEDIAGGYEVNGETVQVDNRQVWRRLSTPKGRDLMAAAGIVSNDQTGKRRRYCWGSGARTQAEFEEPAPW